MTPREHLWSLALLLGPRSVPGRTAWEMSDGEPVDHAAHLEAIDAALAEHEHLRAEVTRLRDVITRAIAASENDGGSASDAVQEMLWILGESELPA